jgi:uncharacterized protein (DUF305 family)
MMHSADSEYEFLVEMLPHHQEAAASAGETAARSVRLELRACTKEMMSAHDG